MSSALSEAWDWIPYVGILSMDRYCDGWFGTVCPLLYTSIHQISGGSNQHTSQSILITQP